MSEIRYGTFSDIKYLDYDGNLLVKDSANKDSENNDKSGFIVKN